MSERRRRAILHIGPMKTGSSSIQHWLRRRATALKEAGFGVPTGRFDANLMRLAQIAVEVARNGAPTATGAEWLRTLRREFEDSLGECPTLVISSEMIGQSLRTAAKVRALRSLLDPMIDRYQVVLYLRRQDEQALSRYSTQLRHGRLKGAILSNGADLDAMLSVWSEVFGREAICPRLFDRESLVNGDVVRDFAFATGLPDIGLEAASPRFNPMLRPEAQRFLEDLTLSISHAGYADQLTELDGMKTIRRVLDGAFAGEGLLPARAEAEAFYASFQASNENVRREWFPDRPTLFSEDFSRYPEQPSPEPSVTAKLDVALATLTALLLGDPRAVIEARAATPVPVREEGRLATREARRRRRAERIAPLAAGVADDVARPS